MTLPVKACRWQINFNPEKCSVLAITRKKSPITPGWSMLGTKLQHYDHYLYLGVEIAQDLDWGDTLRLWPPRPTGPWTSCAEIYLVVVERPGTRPTTPWSYQIDMLGKVQRKAIWFVCSDYSRYPNVSGMMRHKAGGHCRRDVSSVGWACFTRHITIRRHVPSHQTSRWTNPEQRSVMTSNICHLRSTRTLTNSASSPDVF